jgi:hypothetical protein
MRLADTLNRLSFLKDKPLRHYINDMTLVEANVFQRLRQPEAACNDHDASDLVRERPFWAVQSDGPVHDGLRLGSHGMSIVKLPALKARGFPDRNKPQFIALLDPSHRAGLAERSRSAQNGAAKIAPFTA